MKKLLLAITVLITFSYCSNQKPIAQDDLTRVWKASEVISVEGDDPLIGTTIKPFVEKAILSEGLSAGFYPDNTYSILIGQQYEQGTWSFDNKNTVLLGENSFIIDKIEEKDGNRFLIGDAVMADQSFSLTVKLTQEAVMLENFTEDPLHPSNNQWRKKPESKESDEQIKNRLLNYLQHFAYILNASYEREEKSVSFKKSKGIIKVYSGGIGVVDEQEIPSEWSSRFFDTEDAMKAYNMFIENLQKNQYNEASTGSWVKDDYQILMSICNTIKGNE